jgi:hypothetical protein
LKFPSFGPVWDFDELLAQGNSACWSHRLVMVVEDGALIAFVVAAVMNFFNYWHPYRLVLSMHCEPWIR